MALVDPPQNPEQQEPKGDQQRRESSHNDQRGAAPEITALINAIARENRAERKQRRRQDSRREFREWLTIGVVFVAASAALIQAYIFNRQLGEMKISTQVAADAASAAKASATAAQTSAQAAVDTLGFNQETAKATISVDYGSAVTAMTINNSAVRMRINLTLDNNGQLCAKKVAIFTDMDLEGRTTRRDARIAQQSICNKHRAEWETLNTATDVCPKIPFTQEESIGVGAKDIQANRRIEAITAKPFLVPVAYGCVLYFAGSEARETGFKVDFSVSKNTDEGPSERFYISDGTVNATDIGLAPSTSYSK